MSGLIVEVDGSGVTKMPISNRAKRVWENAFGPSAQQGTDDFGVEIRKMAYANKKSPYGWDKAQKRGRL